MQNLELTIKKDHQCGEKLVQIALVVNYFGWMVSLLQVVVLLGACWLEPSLSALMVFPMPLLLGVSQSLMLGLLGIDGYSLPLRRSSMLLSCLGLLGLVASVGLGVSDRMVANTFHALWYWTLLPVGFGLVSQWHHNRLFSQMQARIRDPEAFRSYFFNQHFGSAYGESMERLHNLNRERERFKAQGDAENYHRLAKESRHHLMGIVARHPEFAQVLSEDLNQNQPLKLPARLRSRTQTQERASAIMP